MKSVAPSWLQRLKTWLQRTPPTIPPLLWQETLKGSKVFAHLDAAQRQRLKSLSEAFLATHEFSGAQGLELSDAMLVQISAQACLPILELGLNAYRGWVGVIVYPAEFAVPRQFMDAAGVVHEYVDEVSGEAWEGGPVLISWQDVTQADHGYNVVIHEFAHKLDMLNGWVDGIPALHSGLDTAEWESVLRAAYEDFCARLEHGEPALLDAYAAEDVAEFFAVASEVFFADSCALKSAYPEFHALLRRYYRQDPSYAAAPAA